MIWPFKSKSEKVLKEILTFESRINKALVPLLDKPEKPIAANGALMSMAVNLALYLLAIKSTKVFEKASVEVIAHTVSAFGSTVAFASNGKVSVEDATESILRELTSTQAVYCDALAKARSMPEGGLQKCLDIFLERSGGWAFKDEIERARATIILGAELQRLMGRYKSIL